MWPGVWGLRHSRGRLLLAFRLGCVLRTPPVPLVSPGVHGLPETASMPEGAGSVVIGRAWSRADGVSSVSATALCVQDGVRVCFCAGGWAVNCGWRQSTGHAWGQRAARRAGGLSSVRGDAHSLVPGGKRLAGRLAPAHSLESQTRVPCSAAGTRGFAAAHVR